MNSLPGSPGNIPKSHILTIIMELFFKLIALLWLTLLSCLSLISCNEQSDELSLQAKTTIASPQDDGANCRQYEYTDKACKLCCRQINMKKWKMGSRCSCKQQQDKQNRPHVDGWDR